MAKSHIEKYQNLILQRKEIDEQINQLQQTLDDGIIALIRQNGGFNTDYSILCGALIESLDSINIKTDQHEKWRKVGKNYLRSLSSQKKNSRSVKTDRATPHPQESTIDYKAA